MKYEIIPRNSYKITEQLDFNQHKQPMQGKRYNLKLIKRFDFCSNYQSNSVIIRNELDNSIRFHIKGAPEKIKDICISSSLPANFNEVLKNHTKKGFRVLACASKPLTEEELKNIISQKKKDDMNKIRESNLNNINCNRNSEKGSKSFLHQDSNFIYDNSNELRMLFEKDLLFLGFIIVSNKLKPDTVLNMKQLKESNCKLVMATGDNPLTSVSVSKQASLIEEDQICLIDVEDKELY